MSYYPLPDIPANADPQLRRFCEQTRTAISRLEAYGQPFEVHHLVTNEPGAPAPPIVLDELPVYRADDACELLYATWTVRFSDFVDHAIIISRRDGSGAGEARTVATIIGESATATRWVALQPKRFAETKENRRLLPGHILTVGIAETGGDGPDPPWGLLSMYFRFAEPL